MFAGRSKLFIRFSLSGALFTVLGPLLFWSLYPIGALTALVVAEVLVHLIRYVVFCHFVFTRTKGYIVTPRRYLLSTLPVTLFGIAFTWLLSATLGRLLLTLALSSTSMLVGFLWSRYVYSGAVGLCRVQHNFQNKVTRDF